VIGAWEHDELLHPPEQFGAPLRFARRTTAQTRQIVQNSERHEHLKKVSAARRDCLLWSATVLPRPGDERICGRLPRVRRIDRHATIKLVKLPDYFPESHDDRERKGQRREPAAVDV
jgi:hypothetical protein